MFVHKVAHLKGTICATFYPYTLMDSWFVYWKVKKSDKSLKQRYKISPKCVWCHVHWPILTPASIKGVDVVIIRFHLFSCCRKRCRNDMSYENLGDITWIVWEICILIYALVWQFIGFRLMAFCGRSSDPITPIHELVHTFLPRNTCTKFHLLNLSLPRTNGQTDSHSSLHSDHLYIYNPISPTTVLEFWKW